jgi:metal-responsive CopG/Arc/MetJ family transcriptional regulator
MSVVIELDEKLVAEIDAIAKDFNKNRSQYINETLQKSLRRDLGRKAKLSEEEIGQMYAEAYGTFPVQPDEFEVEDEQTEEFWKQV